ncbi:MAG: ChrR family anti-sigma-E factor, partial [Pseudomonadota bacterium]
MAYAAGRCSEGASLAVAAHVTLCAECRAEVARFEALGGAMLAEEPAPAVEDAAAENDASFAAVAARLDEPANDDRPRVEAGGGPLPRPVVDAIGLGFDDIPWRFRLPGVSEYEFVSEEGETVSLLKVKPGAAIPKHTHKAEELTLVLDGELIDGDEVYGPGDVAVADASVHHHPRAGGDRPCI